MSNSLRPHGLQHTRLPCPSPSPGTCLNSCPLCWWCHPTILSSVIPFSSCLLAFPALGSFPVSQLFASGGQSIEASALGLPMNIQDRFPLGLTDLISLQSKGLSEGLSKVFSNTANSKASILLCSAFFMVQLSHLHVTTGKIIALTIFSLSLKVFFLLSMFFLLLVFFLLSVFSASSLFIETAWQNLNSWFFYLSATEEKHRGSNTAISLLLPTSNGPTQLL